MGSFAAFRRDEAATTGPSALESAVPFDELALLSENVDYFKDKLKVDVAVKYVDDAAADHSGSAAIAEPGKPAVHFVVDKSAAPAKAGGQAKGGDAGKKAAPKAKAAGSFTPIKDLKQLNDLLTHQVYIDGGAGPTASDVAQFAATQSNVDIQQFPHVWRWRNHINFFTP